MNTIAITTSCRHCLDMRLGQLKRAFARAAGAAAFAVFERRAPSAAA